MAMRRHHAMASLGLSLGILISFQPISLAQQQAEAHRKVANKVAPVYPDLARRLQISGTVKVEATVAPNGKVKFTQVIGGSPLLAKAAIDAIEKWQWVATPEETKELIQLNFHPR